MRIINVANIINAITLILWILWCVRHYSYYDTNEMLSTMTEDEHNMKILMNIMNDPSIKI